MDLGQCFDNDELKAFVQLPSPVLEQYHLDHLDSCETCRQRLDSLLNQSAPGSIQPVPKVTPALSKVMAQSQALSPQESGTATASPGHAVLTSSNRPDLLGLLGSDEVSHVLGEGAMGVVFAARDPALNREVAIKVPAAALIATPDARERFLRAARSMPAVKHEHIVTVDAVDIEANTPFLVMERIEGQSLAQRNSCRQNRPMRK